MVFGEDGSLRVVERQLLKRMSIGRRVEGAVFVGHPQQEVGHVV